MSLPDPLDSVVLAPQTALTGYLEPMEPCVLSDAGLQRQDERVIGNPGFKEDQREVAEMQKNDISRGNKYYSLVRKIKRNILLKCLVKE